MRTFFALHAALLVVACDAANTADERTKQETGRSLDAPISSLPAAVVANDNRVASGTLSGGVLEVELVASRGKWAMAGTTDSSVTVSAFGVKGQPASIPGPLIRAALGTRVRIGFTNTLGDTLALCPMYTLRCAAATVERVAPGARIERAFIADRWGATIYRAELIRNGSIMRWDSDAELMGALIVDSSATAPPHERVIVLNSWSPPNDSIRFVQTLNGKTWPFTERLSYNVGDSTRWRLINAGGITEHPMHLHGFYFRVDAHGDVTGDTLLAPDQRTLAVTENLRPWGVATITWTPTRGGNWLFHCHKTAHMSGLQHYSLSGEKPPAALGHSDVAAHVARGMGGLIMGVEVRGDPNADSTVATGPVPSPRRLRLVMRERAGFYRGKDTGYLFALESEGSGSPTVGAIPGPLLVLKRGEPVEIAVVNRLKTASTVHWHGIELESFYDGVAGWSGIRGSLTPMVAPSDSFVARFTPPRSGTFMYHAHVNEDRQLTAGLYAPLVVLDPGEEWDPKRDHIILFSQDGTDDQANVVVNGRIPATPVRLTRSEPHRLRMINITAMDEVEGELLLGSSVQSWRLVAKDGATTSATISRPRRAAFHLGPGEIIDVEVTLGRGDYGLKIHSYNDFTIPIRVP